MGFKPSGFSVVNGRDRSRFQQDSTDTFYLLGFFGGLEGFVTPFFVNFLGLVVFDIFVNKLISVLVSALGVS